MLCPLDSGTVPLVSVAACGPCTADGLDLTKSQIAFVVSIPIVRAKSLMEASSKLYYSDMARSSAGVRVVIVVCGGGGEEVG